MMIAAAIVANRICMKNRRATMIQAAQSKTIISIILSFINHLIVFITFNKKIEFLFV